MGNPTASAQTEPARIVVHWLERSRAQRLVWLLEEGKVNYEIKAYKRVHGHAPPEMKEIQLLGKSPMLTIDDPEQSRRLVMAESGSIFEYIVDHYAPNLAPKRYMNGREGRPCGETESWLRYRYYMHYCEGSLMSLLLRKHTLDGVSDADSSSMNTLLESNLTTHLSFLESQISSAPDHGPFLCGETLTAADIMMSFPLLLIQNGMGGLSRYPQLDAYVNRLTSEDSFRASIKRAEAASGEDYRLV